MIAATRVGSGGADHIRRCFVFTVSFDGSAQVKRFRDPVALRILSDVGQRLASAGFNVTSVKPGKACDGRFGIRFKGFEIEVVVTARRQEHVVACAILTWPINSRWHRAPQAVVSHGWADSCAAIERILAKELQVSSLRRVTEDEVS